MNQYTKYTNVETIPIAKTIQGIGNNSLECLPKDQLKNGAGKYKLRPKVAGPKFVPAKPSE